MSGRLRREHDNDKGFVAAMMNGKGLFLSRVMIIGVLPVVTGIITGLAAYAGNLLMDKIETHFQVVEHALEDLDSSAKGTQEQIAGLRIDVTKLQVQQDDLKDRVGGKH